MPETKVNMRLVEILCCYRTDPSNAGYVFLLIAYTEQEIDEAIEYIKEINL